MSRMIYDTENRLVSSVSPGSSTHNLTFSYDRYGWCDPLCWPTPCALPRGARTRRTSCTSTASARLPRQRITGERRRRISSITLGARNGTRSAIPKKNASTASVIGIRRKLASTRHISECFPAPKVAGLVGIPGRAAFNIPQSLNLYSYVHNSPTNKVDPHSPAKSVSTGLNKCIENAKCSMEPAWIVWNYSSRDARLSGVHQLWIFRTRRHPRVRRDMYWDHPLTDCLCLTSSCVIMRN